MDTFLEIVREVVRETGLGGGNPNDLETVEDQEGDFLDAVKWTAEGALQVDSLWKTWKYLWFEHVIAFQGSHGQVPPLPTGYDVRQWDRDTFWLNKGLTSPVKLRFEDWRTFRQRSAAAPTRKPSAFTVRPDNTLRTDSIPNTNYTFSAEGWRRPARLQFDDDEPLMPNEYRRIIVCRAKIIYADQRDAPEILEGAQAEYTDILDKLQSDQLESHEFDRMSEQDLDLSIETP